MSEIKVGDELAFDCGYGRGMWQIAAVTKITPSGRVQCGFWTLDPDLRVRGKTGYGGPIRGVPVTDEIRDQVERDRLLELLASERNWHTLTLDQLRRIVAITEAGG